MKMFLLFLFMALAPSFAGACELQMTGGELLVDAGGKRVYDFDNPFTLQVVGCESPGLTVGWYTNYVSNHLADGLSYTPPFGSDPFPGPNHYQITAHVASGKECDPDNGNTCYFENFTFEFYLAKKLSLPVLTSTPCIWNNTGPATYYIPTYTLTGTFENPNPPEFNVPVKYVFAGEESDPIPQGAKTETKTLPGAFGYKLGDGDKQAASIEELINDLGWLATPPVFHTQYCQKVAPYLVSVTPVTSRTRSSQIYRILAETPDSHETVTYSVAVTQAPPGADYELTDSTGTLVPADSYYSVSGNFGLIASVPGTYTVNVTLTDSSGLSRSETREIGGTPFTVKLASDGKEYLFGNCAPNSTDDCRTSVYDAFQAGEFLTGDTIELSGVDSAGSFDWLITNNFTGIGTALHGQNQQFVLPNAGVYTVSLNGSSNAKDLLAEDRIQASYKATAPFVQTKKLKSNGQNNPNDLGTDWGNAKEPFSAYGCTVAASGNLFNREIGVTNLKDVNAMYATAHAYSNVNQLDLRMIPVVRNSLTNQNKPSPDHYWHNAPLIGFDMPRAIQLARQRKYAILRVHRVKDVGDSDQKRNHFLTLSGVANKSGVLVPIIVDPSDDTRASLDDPLWGSKFRSIQYYEVGPQQGTRGTGQLFATTSSEDIQFVAGRKDGKELFSNKNGQKNRKFTNGTISLDLIGDDSDSNPELPGLGGYQLTLDDTRSGTYSFDVASASEIDGEVDINVINSEGELAVRRMESVHLSPGEIKTFNVSVTDQSAFLGMLSLTSYQVNDDKLVQAKVTEIRGTMNASEEGNGFDLATEDLNLNFGSQSYSIPAGRVESIGQAYNFVDPNASSGIRAFHMDASGHFEFQIINLDARVAYPSNDIPFELQIGDDKFVGRVLHGSLLAGDPVSILLSKSSYRADEKASGSLSANFTPTNDNFEFYLDLHIDSKKNNASNQGSNLWNFTLPRLPSGIHFLNAKLFLQDKRKAKETKQAVNIYEQQIWSIEQRIHGETDPDVILQLKQQKRHLRQMINELEWSLQRSRSQLGRSVDEPVFVR